MSDWLRPVQLDALEEHSCAKSSVGDWLCPAQTESEVSSWLRPKAQSFRLNSCFSGKRTISDSNSDSPQILKFRLIGKQPAMPKNHPENLRNIKATGIAEKCTWTCNHCHVQLEHNTSKGVSRMRSKHITRAHKGLKPGDFHQVRVRYNPVPALPGVTNGWICGFCMKGIPPLPNPWMRASQREHMRVCEAAPDKARNKLDRVLNKKKLWKAMGKPKDWQQNYRKGITAHRQEAKRDEQLIKLQEHSSHNLVYVKNKKGHDSRYTCTECTKMWRMLAEIQREHDKGLGCNRTERPKRIQDGARIRFWGDSTQSWKNKLSRVWKLTHKEKLVLTRRNTLKIPKKTAQKHTEWNRDLVEDGDVESNPGPQSLHCMSWNAQGHQNCFRIFDYFIQKHTKIPDVIFMQETNMSSTLAKQFDKVAQRNGFRCWFQNTSKSSCRGGVLTLVKKTLKSTFYFTCESEGGFALAVALENILMVNIYQAHDGLPHGLQSEIQELHTGLPHQWDIVIAGDFNIPPTGREFGALHKLYVKDEHMEPLPSRWKGDRCIDWALSSLPLDLCRYDHTALSDHKAFVFEIPGKNAHGQNFEMIPTPMLLPKPENKMWKARFHQCWKEWKHIPPSTTEEEWRVFNVQAQQIHEKALQQCGEKAAKGHMRTKGSLPATRPIGDQSLKKPYCDSFYGRRLANALGRWLEYDRQCKTGHWNTALLAKCRKNWPLNARYGFDTQQNIAQLQSALAQEHHQRHAKQIELWKEKMNKGGKQATAWLKQNDQNTPVSIYDNRENGQQVFSADSQEAIAMIEAFWRRIWDRRCADLSTAMEYWRKWNEPTAHALQDHPLSIITGENLQAAAHRLRGTAAGPCGWHGDELASWPREAWDAYAELVGRWMNRGQFPELWRHSRQIQLPKPEADQYRGALQAKELRPISVLSGLWRVITTTMAKDISTQQWSSTFLPEQSHGSIPGRDVFTAIKDLEFHHTRKNLVLTSLDYQKCFDHVSPKLALAAMREAGLPTQWIQMLDHVWCSQKRWIQFAKCTAPNAVLVTTSLPQGDGLCPLALNVLMASPVRAIEHEFGGPRFQQNIYLDDRNFVCTAEKVPHVLRTWQQWSNILGLKDNHAKTKIICRSSAQKLTLREAKVPEEYFASTARILGIDFCERRNAAHRPTALQRMHQAEQIAARINTIRMAALRAWLWRTRVIPLATWGHVLRLPSLKDWSTLSSQYRRAFLVHQQASPDLNKILEGHMNCPIFMAGMNNIAAWMRIHATAIDNTLLSSYHKSFGSWESTIANFLHKYGWREISAHHWYHDVMQQHLQWNDANIQRKSESHHLIRESWRRWSFQRFLDSQRRDAWVLNHSTYDEQSCKMARSLYNHQSGHGRAVMTGAAWSPAMYEINYSGRVSSICCYCHHRTTADLQHVMWICPAFACERPETPTFALQNRLGWPDPAKSMGYAKKVLEHMARVRAIVLKDAWQ